MNDKVAVVSGAAHGIGAATAEILSREGAHVAVTDLREAEGHSVVERIKDANGAARFWLLDVSNKDDIARVFGEVTESFGSLDILVNNAGISGINKPTHEIDAEGWFKVIDVNVNGVFYCTKHAISHMRDAGGGSIVNLSSIYGIISATDLPAYHASKGAVRLMTRTDALIYAKDGIRVNSVHLGFIWTPLVEALAEKSPDGRDAFRDELDSRHPIGHVGQPEDIEAGILYLAFDEAKFVTGAELVIGGGYTAR